jgi:hypothetical protein
VRQAACGRKANDELGASRMELPGNQYRIGPSNRARDDSAGNAFEFEHVHGRMKTGPREERLGPAVLNKAVRQAPNLVAWLRG